MKAILISLAVLVSTVPALAFNEPTIVKVSQFANLMPPIPQGGVVPRTTVTVKYSACSTFHAENFELSFVPSTKLSLPALSVQIAPQTMDCMGPSFKRTIELEMYDVPVIERVLVLQNEKQVLLKVKDNYVY